MFDFNNLQESEQVKILDFLSLFKTKIEKEQQETRHESKEVIKSLIDAGMMTAINTNMSLANDDRVAPEIRLQASTTLITLFSNKDSICG
jgi:hypothetical protein